LALAERLGAPLCNTAWRRGPKQGAPSSGLVVCLRQIKPRLSKIHNLTLALAPWPRQPLSLGQSGAAHRAAAHKPRRAL